MTDLLRSAPVPVPVGSAWFALGTTAIAVALTVGGSTTATMTRASLAPAPTPIQAATTTTVTPAAAIVAQPSLPTDKPAPARAEKAEAYFVFQVDGAPYVRIADLEDLEDGPAARHAAPLRLAQREGAVFAFAPLAPSEVPAPYRGWAQKSLIVGESCRARVTGLAVVSQLVGDAGYADLDGDWTAASVFEQGRPMIAARLDDCGEHALARDAAAAPFVIPTKVDDPRTAAAAKRALLASATSTAAQNRWLEGGGEGRWQDSALFDVRILKHPTTGKTWVVAFARNEADDCGVPEINLLATFQLGDNGKLRPVTSRLVSELHSLDQVLDIDGDGDLELVGKPWLGLDHLITDAQGEVQDRLEIPFFGCPC